MAMTIRAWSFFRQRMTIMKNMRIRSGGLAGVRRAIGSGFILATDSARKSGDLGMHGLVKIVILQKTHIRELR